MPKWEDFFAYGYPLDRIFKFTPPRGENIEVPEAPVKSSYTVKPPVTVDEDEDEVSVPAPEPKKKPVSKPVFDEDENDDDSDDELSLGWMGNK